MMLGMTTKAKIAVTLDPARVAAAKRAVAEGRAPSVSAYVERALLEFENGDGLDALLDEMLDRTGGPLTDAERERFDRELGL